MKGILLTEYSIGYRVIPKVACTSIKDALYKLKIGKDFSEDELGMHVHHYFDREITDISDAKFKFIVIREPIKRFLSGYSNRVTHHWELSEEYLGKIKNGIKLLEKKTVPTNPSLSDFIGNLDEYLMIPTIKHHFRPVTEIFDEELDYFDKVYRIEELYELEEDISSKTNKDFILPRLQTGGRKIPLSDLDGNEFEYLVDFYKKDYELMKEFYTVDDIYKTWKR